jgi:NADPH:quinone reductase-like Zn-dependent oxidoreductase
MRAMVFREYGDPHEVLRLEELPTPTPKEGEVLVRIHAASINDWDWGVVRGKPFINRLLFGLRSPNRPVLGLALAGVVEGVGPGVAHLRPGDRVHGDQSEGSWGGFAEFVTARERDLRPIPDGMPFDEAAAVPHVAALALQGLEAVKPAAAGDRILINGGGGGVGTLAIQVAHHLGTEVTAVDSASKLEAMRLLGADHVVDYAAEDVTRNGVRYQRILDVGGFRSIAAFRRSLAPDGVHRMIGGTMPRIVEGAALGPLLSAGGARSMGLLALKANGRLERFHELYEAGAVRPVIDRRFPLEALPDAFRYYAEGRFVGKIVVTI